MIELLECAGLDLLGEEVVGRHHHVVPGTPGQQFAFQGFVGIEDVVDQLDPGLVLEVGEGGLADVVGPVVDADLWLAWATALNSTASAAGTMDFNRRISTPLGIIGFFRCFFGALCGAGLLASRPHFNIAVE